MDGVRMIYDEIRETWNIFLGAEWYFESKDYEQADAVYMNLVCSDDYE